MYKWIGLDIETRSNPAVAEKLWKPGEYKTPGNIKDAAKLAAHRQTWEESQVDLKRTFIEKAALSPLTGSVVVIGLITDEGKEQVMEGDERKILTDFWMLFGMTDNAVTKFVFWSGCGGASDMFDFDFLVTRSRLLGVRIPAGVRDGRFYNPRRVVDLASEFLLYKSQEYLSLSNAGELFGLYENDDLRGTDKEVHAKGPDDVVKGANFAFHYDQGGDRRVEAIAYLRNDLLLLYHLAHRIL